MAFRYRILLFHENQPWVSQMISLVDVPLFHLYITDSASMVQKYVTQEDIHIILTAYSTHHYLLVADDKDSMRYQNRLFWEAVFEQNRDCQVILLCNQDELAMASHLAQKGMIADYVAMSPFFDKHRLLVLLMKTLESALLRELVKKHLLEPTAQIIPLDLFERIELLQELKEPPIPPPSLEEESPVEAGPKSEEADAPADDTDDSAETIPTPAEEPAEATPEQPMPPAAEQTEAPPLNATVFSNSNSVFSVKKGDYDKKPSQTAVAKTGLETTSVQSETLAKLAGMLGNKPAEIEQDDDDTPMQKKRQPKEPSIVPFFEKVNKKNKSGNGDEEKTTDVMAVLKKHREKVETQQQEAEAEQRNKALKPWSKLKKGEYDILLIDSQPDNTFMIQTMLEEKGYKVLVANNVETGQEWLNTMLFDMLLVNMELPDKNGLEFLYRLRYKGPQRDIPAIVLSGQATEDHVIKSIKAEAYYFMVKPFQPELLLKQIDEIMVKLGRA